MPKKVGPDGACKDWSSRAREAPDLPALLALVAQVEKAKLRELSPGGLAAVLNTLATKAAAHGAAGALAGEALQAGEALLGAAVERNGGKPPESAITVMVRLCCASGAQKRALSLVEEACEAGMRPKLRTLAAILAQASAAGDAVTCEGVWAKLQLLGLQPQDNEYAAMLRGLKGQPARRREVLRQLLGDLPLPADPPLIEEIGRTFGVEGVAGLQGSPEPFRAGRPEDGRPGWSVGWTAIDTEGVCRLSRRRLRALGLPPHEERELLACAARLANDSGCNRGFKLFQKWLSKQEPYDIVIDGANVGFNNQNREGGHFQYNQIDMVVNHFRSTGQRMLLVLHPKWLREDADLGVTKRKRRKFDQISKGDTLDPLDCEEEDDEDGEGDVVYPHNGTTAAERSAAPGTALHMVRTWKELGVLVAVPPYDCDDWYWLYAALDSKIRGRDHVQVVSNDQMRDHHWRMDSARQFLQWQDRHMTRLSLQFGEDTDGLVELKLYPPRPYSLCAQVAEDAGAWHFPVPAIRSRAEQIQSGRPVALKEIEAADHHWLVAWQDPEPPAQP